MDVDEKHAPRPGSGSDRHNSADAGVAEKAALHGRDIEERGEVGQLTELEVDLSRVLHQDEEAEGDWDADTSPFAAVRAVVPETDDPGMPVNTFRAWFLGIVSLTQKPLTGQSTGAAT
jgi:hypothetical protein